MYNRDDMLKAMVVLERNNRIDFENQCERLINEGYIPSSTNCQNDKYICIFILNAVLNNE